MLFFDIGANIGKWSKANIEHCDKIIAIEASPKTFKSLNKWNKNENIITLNYAVCNNNGNDINFYHVSEHCGVLSTINKDWVLDKNGRFKDIYKKAEKVVCKTITIDNLIKKYGLPDLIKIDVEGGEYECISSLSQKVNLLCFEWTSELNNISFKCLEHLINLGFNQFYIQTRDNYKFRPKDNDFYDLNTTKNKLLKTTPRKEWGMLWCK